MHINGRQNDTTDMLYDTEETDSHMRVITLKGQGADKSFAFAVFRVPSPDPTVKDVVQTISKIYNMAIAEPVTLFKNREKCGQDDAFMSSQDVCYGFDRQAKLRFRRENKEFACIFPGKYKMSEVSSFLARRVILCGVEDVELKNEGNIVDGNSVASAFDDVLFDIVFNGDGKIKTTVVLQNSERYFEYIVFSDRDGTVNDVTGVIAGVIGCSASDLKGVCRRQKVVPSLLLSAMKSADMEVRFVETEVHVIMDGSCTCKTIGVTPQTTGKDLVIAVSEQYELDDTNLIRLSYNNRVIGGDELIVWMERVIEYPIVVTCLEEYTFVVDGSENVLSFARSDKFDYVIQIIEKSWRKVIRELSWTVDGAKRTHEPYVMIGESNGSIEALF